jgi:hypothetical protein
MDYQHTAAEEPARTCGISCGGTFDDNMVFAHYKVSEAHDSRVLISVVFI